MKPISVSMLGAAVMGALGILAAAVGPGPIPGITSLVHPLVKSGTQGSMPKASAAADGYLSSADFATFSAGVTTTDFTYIQSDTALFGDVTITGTCVGCGGGGASETAEASTSMGAFYTGNNSIPWDNTQPQGCTGGHTEGLLVLSTGFTASSPASRITIEAIAQVGSDGVNAGICYVTTDGGPALSHTVSLSTISTGTAASEVSIMSPQHFASDTARHVYNLCCALNSAAGAMQINGATVGGGATFNGFMDTALKVFEDSGGSSTGGGTDIAFTSGDISATFPAVTATGACGDNGVPVSVPNCVTTDVCGIDGATSVSADLAFSYTCRCYSDTVIVIRSCCDSSAGCGANTQRGVFSGLLHRP